MRLRKLLLISTLFFSFLLLFGGCDKFPGSSARSDGQVQDDVKARLNADASVTNKQIDVAVKDGIVTLNGQVGSETERLAAANDAAIVPGVKTVVNDLQMQTASMAPLEAPIATPVAPSSAGHRAKPTAVHSRSTASSMPSHSTSPAVVPVAAVHQEPAPANAPQPRRPDPVVVTVPVGTRIAIRLDHELSSETNKPGDTFRATLDAPITDDQKVIIPAHTSVEGRVTDVKSAAKFKGSSLLTLDLTQIYYGGRTYELVTDHWTKEGAGRGKNTAAKVGGGAAVGALIGGLIGGGKGAAIGAGVGAGAGTTAQAVTKGQAVELPSETVLTFRLESPITVTLPPPGQEARRESLPVDNN